MKGADLDNEIIKRLRAELERCRSKWALLSKQTGRRLSYRWIVAFAGGEIREPSFQKICLLGEYLGMRISTSACGHFLKFKPGG